MLISIIITTKNEERNIGKCLESVLAQKYPRESMEIILVDNDSVDKTREISRKYTDKVFAKGPERSAQKNFGVEKSKGEYFLHLDADMRLSENVVSECVKKISEDKKIIALYIPEKIIGRGFWGKVRNFERSFYDGTVIDGVRFIRRDKFIEAGGFDENLYACEDWDLDKRIKKIGKVELIQSPPCPAPQDAKNKNLWYGIYHNESKFSLSKYLAKKKYYAKNMDVYIKKWGKNDPDVKKQFGFYYRLIGVFIENSKLKKMVRHPLLAVGMYFLRILVGIKFLTRRI